MFSRPVPTRMPEIHRARRFFWLGVAAMPLFQMIGCSLFDPRVLWRIAFSTVLEPLANPVLTAASGLAAGL